MIGERIGSYRIVRKIGEGGMGAVYEAQHEQIGRRAAVKVLRAEMARDPQIAARFLNEARAANLVQHAGIVDIYEFGQTPAGAAYIIMQYLDGDTLRARLLRQGRMGADTQRLGRQLASVLEAAHEKQIVHRDLKPDNIMIVRDTETPGGERVKVLDFGIAKVAAELQAPGGPRTHTGLLLGTPAYMAPEQCRGLTTLDDRADVYSLGIILYEMVGGAPPFRGDMGELIAAHLYQPPPPLPPGLPGTEEMADLLWRMLAKAPAQRPSMRQVAAELELQGTRRASAAADAVPMVPPMLVATQSQTSTMGRSVGQAVPVPRQDRRWWVAGAVLLGVALLSSVGITQWRGSTAPVPAVQPGPGAPTPPPRRVHWVVRSEPQGAQVVRQADGKVLGVTPWQEEHEAVRGAFAMVLRKQGYEDRHVLLRWDQDEILDERLDREEPAAPPPAEVSRPNGKGAKKQKATKVPAQDGKPTMWD